MWVVDSWQTPKSIRSLYYFPLHCGISFRVVFAYQHFDTSLLRSFFADSWHNLILLFRRVCAPTKIPLFNSCSAVFSRVTSIHSDRKSTRTSFNAFLEELLEELVLLVAHSQSVVSFSLFFFFLACPPSATMLAYIALLGVLLLVCLWCCAVTMGSPNMAGEAPV